MEHFFLFKICSKKNELLLSTSFFFRLIWVNNFDYIDKMSLPGEMPPTTFVFPFYPFNHPNIQFIPLHEFFFDNHAWYIYMYFLTWLVHKQITRNVHFIRNTLKKNQLINFWSSASICSPFSIIFFLYCTTRN